MPKYPLYDNEADSLQAGSGRALRDVTLEAVLDGSMTLDDLQVHRDALVAQAEIARAAGIDRKHLYTLMKKHNLDVRDSGRKGLGDE